MVAETLQCKPIQGHDLPLADLQKSTRNGELAKGGQQGGAELLEVTHLDNFRHVQIESASKPKLADEDQILHMLLPNTLQAPCMDFISCEDISSLKSEPVAPKTGYQQVRQEKPQIEQKVIEEDRIPEEERQRTIRCLLNIMRHQVSQVDQQARQLDEGTKQTEQAI